MDYSGRPLSEISLSVVSVTQGQPSLETVNSPADLKSEGQQQPN